MTPYFADDAVTLWHGDALAVLGAMPDASVDCVVTSPPYYGLRDYGGEPGQIGVEEAPQQYVDRLAAVFGEARRVLHPAGTLWLNLGDTYAGKGNAGASVGRTRRADRAEVIPARRNTTAEAPYKSLLMLPERVVLALIGQGWTLRNKIVWNKTDAMPESVRDRLSSRHEPIFLLTRSAKYWFDLDPIREPVRSSGRSWQERRAAGAPKRHGTDGAAAGADSDFAANQRGRNPGDVWNCSTAGFPGAHFAVMPEWIAERCIAAGCRPGGIVLDPFAGSCTTGKAAGRLGRRFVGVDLHRPYLDLALRTRLAQTTALDVPGGAA